jgi:hypothetical protein
MTQGKGWKRESERHKLSANGIKNKYGVKTLIGRNITNSILTEPIHSESMVTDSGGRNYNIFNGTAYHNDTPNHIVKILEWARTRNQKPRLRVYYGDVETGRDWEEEHEVIRYVGRSTGSIKIPLLVNNKNSHGGGGILDNCIVGIEYANRREGGVIYKHPKYHLQSDEGYKE